MRFRFTTRDLLWLTAVIALVLGWWLDHRDLKWTAAKDLDFETKCKAKVQTAHELRDAWKSIADNQAAMVRRLQKYFRDKHPNEQIDWDAVNAIPDIGDAQVLGP